MRLSGCKRHRQYSIDDWHLYEDVLMTNAKNPQYFWVYTGKETGAKIDKLIEPLFPTRDAAREAYMEAMK